LLLQHFLPVRGGQFPPELGGQFPAESVVSLHRNQVVNISEFSSYRRTLFRLSVDLVEIPSSLVFCKTEKQSLQCI
jgi:hypothetical protein